MQNGQKIVLVWVWGTGMSGIAGILLDLWYTNIIGIDSEHWQLTDNLEKRWLNIIYGHGNYTVNPWDTIIYSAAAEQSPEVIQAQQLLQDYPKWMLVCNYFQFLGEISKYCRTLAIAWTNGKSTTTALALYAAGRQLKDFWLWILGALLPDFDNHSYCINQEATAAIKNIFTHIFTGKWLDYSIIKKYIFIVEACEYKRHFLHLDPDYSVITSLELDHTDYYTDIHDYQNAFLQLLSKTKEKVFLAPGLDSSWIPREYKDKRDHVDLDTFVTDCVFGAHYMINISLVKPALDSISQTTLAKDTRRGFHGLWRRMEYLNTTDKGAKIYTDYAHMSSSLHIVYTSLHQHFPDKKICAIFQPHQVHRILQSWEEFAQSLQSYDDKILYNIYAARENVDKIYEHNGMVVWTVKEIWHTLARDVWCKYETDFGGLWEKIESYDDNRIVVILTAGDLDYYVRNTLKDK